MRVVAYLRASVDAPLALVRTTSEQQAVIEAWGRARRHRIVAVTTDTGKTAGPGLSTRAGLADALGAIREGVAEVLAVASLDRISPEVVEQELVRGELIRRGGALRSTVRAEERAITDHPDPERALIRRVLEAADVFSGTVRDLHVLYRIRARAAGTDAEEAVMARIEYLAERGATAREIAGSVLPGERLGTRLRARLRPGQNQA